MTEVRLKQLAWDILSTGDRHVTDKERTLAAGVLTYFDPSFFVKSKEAQEKSLKISDARREKENADSEKGYLKWLAINKRKAEAKK